MPIAEPGQAVPDARLLGRKGAGLVVMRQLGLPVPPGFVLTTELGQKALANYDAFWPLLWEQIAPACATLAKEAGQVRPLQLAVRSSPTVSMPGMMDTLLDVPFEQAKLRAAILAVLRSADSPRVGEYRRLYLRPGMGEDGQELGVAVVIQAMVQGDRGPGSAAGVLFTRNPSTGEPLPYGEFLPRARGVDVVSGTKLARPLGELAELLPEAYRQLLHCGDRLERHFRDMQDIEFTIEEGTLWLLQTRSGQRSGQAMVRIAADLCREGLLDSAAALSRIAAPRLAEILRPIIPKDAPRTLLTRGLPASPGVATGKVVFSSAEVELAARRGESTILVRLDTSPEDISGMRLSAGILTVRGGMTSHAAVVARGLGRCAVVGASALHINSAQKTLSTPEHTIHSGDVLTLDGHTGEVLLGEVAMSMAHVAKNTALNEVLSWTESRSLQIYALVGSSTELQLARELGAAGIVDSRMQSGPWTLHRPAPLAPKTADGYGAPLRGMQVADAAALDALCSSLRQIHDNLLGPNAPPSPPVYDFVVLFADLDLEKAVPLIRAAQPGLLMGLAAAPVQTTSTSMAASDEKELGARARALGLQFIVCPPKRLPIAAVTVAQLALCEDIASS